MQARFRTLDGMRGLAAVIVLLEHAWPVTSSSCRAYDCNVAHGHLAVDMFFALSGFVLSYRYDGRFAAGMTMRQFMVARIVRLYPLFWLAVILGAIPLVRDMLKGVRPIGATVVALLANTLLLPSPTPGAFPDPFPVVSPAWSLFMELFVANLVFALFWRQLRGRALAIVTGVSFVLLALAAVRFGTVNAGSLWITVPQALPRVMFSFFAGVLIQRLHARAQPLRVPGFLVLAVLTATFWPRFGPTATIVYELVCVGLFYPCLIFLGASARERNPRLGQHLGDISYALYLVHIPILFLVLRLSAKAGLRPGTLLLSCFLVLSFVAGWLADRYYDPPARRRLSGLLQPWRQAGGEAASGPRQRDRASGPGRVG